MTLQMRKGRPGAPGPTLLPGGVRFVLPSVHATRVELCLFDPSTEKEIFRADLPGRDGEYWHGEVSGAGPGTLYGYRVHGPWAPEAGHRFDPAKLLIDPWAREWSGEVRHDPALFAGPPGDAPDGRDTAAFVPKGVVTAQDDFDWQDDERPATPWAKTFIYEAHPRGLTLGHPDVPEQLRGRPLGLVAPAMLAHYRRLGITALELMPIAAYADEAFLLERGLRNWWGYQTVGPMALMPRWGQGDLRHEFKTMVQTLHREGIEVLLDVVFNHTGEGGDTGPTLSLRGIDNAGYYRLDAQGGYVNFAGTGNTLDLTHTMALRLVMDSLRHWAVEYRVDGFRFDLGVTLAREDAGFYANGGFLRALRQDPVLAPLKLIVEPWDLGPAGYQLGRFPRPVAEWNDMYRDGVRRFWRGDGQAAELARRLAGSAELFDHGLRAPWAGVNYLASHDGFTLQDAVSYKKKRNHANGEGNRDGHSGEVADNLGHEGPTEDAGVLSARVARVRAMLATLFLSQGTPMLCAGDEFGNSQGGNNNAYAQDNQTGWLDWGAADDGLIDFVARLSGLRRAQELLRQPVFLHGQPGEDGRRDLVWRRADGAEVTGRDWHDPGFRCLGMQVHAAADGPGGAGGLYAIFNAGDETVIVPPEGDWRCLFDSAGRTGGAPMAAQSVRLYAEGEEEAR